MTVPLSRGADPLVTIVLPAKNEQAAIGRTLRALPVSTLRALGLQSEVFVLDGRSQDATAAIAKHWGARVVADPEPGKGAALRNAIGLFRGQYVVMLDADGTYPADAIPRVLAPLVRGDADIAMGTRQPQPGAMSTHHFLGNAMISLVASVLYGKFCQDVCTGLWAFRSDALRALPLESQGFGLEAELFSLSTRMGLRTTQVRIDYLPRQGEKKLSGGPDGLRIVRRLMRSRFVPLPTPLAPKRRPTVPHPTPTPEVQG